ncbi:MAG: FeoA family protein [Methanotrichaceae archaeon]
MMLTDLRPGDCRRIVAIMGGRGARKTLASRGIFEGSAVRVISCRGPVVIEINRNTVALGRGIAQKIRVM